MGEASPFSISEFVWSRIRRLMPEQPAERLSTIPMDWSRFHLWLLILGFHVSILPHAELCAQERVSIRDVLGSDVEDEPSILDALEREGPSVVRRLRKQAAEQALLPLEHRKLNRFIYELNARLLDLPIQAVLLLEWTGTFENEFLGHDENAVLLRIAEQGAVKRDLGRKMLLEALVRRYQRLIRIPADRRWRYTSEVNPREIVRRILEQPLEEEEARFVSEHVEVFLYHPWVSRILGIEKMVWRYIESEHIKPGLFTALREKLAGTLRGSCEERFFVGQYSSHGEPRIQTPEFMFTNDAPDDWPCLPDSMIIPLWRSPAATEEDRDIMFAALVDAVLVAGPDALRKERYRNIFLWLQQEKLLSEKRIRFAVDKMLSTWKPVRPEQAQFILWSFRDLTLTVRDGGLWGEHGWKEFERWWRSEECDISWITSSGDPKSAEFFVFLERQRGEVGADLLAMQLLLESGKLTRRTIDTGQGYLSLRVRAWPVAEQSGEWIVSSYAILTAERDAYEDLAAAPPVLTQYRRISHGVDLTLNESFTFEQGEAPRGALLVLHMLSASQKKGVAQIRPVEVIDRLCQGLSDSWIFNRSYPDERLRFLPKDVLIEMARCSLSRFDEDEAFQDYDDVQTALRMARYISEHGEEAGVECLQQWVSNKWRRWEEAAELLPDCEKLLAVAEEAGDESNVISMLLDPKLRDTIIRSLARDEKYRLLGTNRRTLLAARIAVEVLPQIDGPGPRYQLIRILQAYSGQQFGYQPVGHADSQREALNAWIRWGQDIVQIDESAESEK